MLNRYVRKKFSLDSVMMRSEDSNEFLPKDEMMNRLLEYENLINAIGALQFTNRNM